MRGSASRPARRCPICSNWRRRPRCCWSRPLAQWPVVVLLVAGLGDRAHYRTGSRIGDSLLHVADQFPEMGCVPALGHVLGAPVTASSRTRSGIAGTSLSTYAMCHTMRSLPPPDRPSPECMRLVTVITFTITNGKIVAIDVIADTQRLGQLIIESPPRQVCVPLAIRSRRRSFGDRLAEALPDACPPATSRVGIGPRGRGT